MRGLQHIVPVTVGLLSTTAAAQRLEIKALLTDAGPQCPSLPCEAWIEHYNETSISASPLKPDHLVVATN